MATSQDFVNWVCSEALDPDFLMHLFMAEHDSILSFGKGTVHKTIYYPEAKAFHIVLPPLNEQRRIVAKIEALQERSRRAREALEAIPPLLEKLRQAILAAAFRGDLTKEWREQHPDVEPASEMVHKAEIPPRPHRYARRATNVRLGDYGLSIGNPRTPLPKGWSWTPLVDIGRLESGHTPSRKHPEYWNGDIPWVGIKDARDYHGSTIYTTHQHTNEIGIANSAARLLPAGTVCLTRTAASIGYTVVMGRPMSTSQDLVNWVCTESLEPHWLKYLFISERRSLFSFGEGSAHATVYYPEILAFHVALPPIDEQREIVRLLDERFLQIEIIRSVVTSAIHTHDRIGNSILSKAFRGELVPQDPHDEPASVLLERIRAERAKAEAEKKTKGKGRSGRGKGATRGKKTQRSSKTKKTLSGVDPELEPSPREAVFYKLQERARSKGVKPEQLGFADLSQAAEDVLMEELFSEPFAPPPFLELPPNVQFEIIHRIMLGLGAIEPEAAVQELVTVLEKEGLLGNASPEDERFAQALDQAVRQGMKKRRFDKPSPGLIRAILPDAKDYRPEHWKMCVEEALGDEPIEDEAAAIREAADWARENMGLEFKRLQNRGVIYSGIAKVVNESSSTVEIDT